MTDSNDDNNAPETAGPMTVGNINVALRAFSSEELATQVGETVGAAVQELSRYINLSALDGMTIAHDYNQALLDLDRGFQTSYPLTPTEEFGIGVAMAPIVIRDGVVKTHIVLSGWIAEALLDKENANFKFALHVLAHECSHVEINMKFDTAFPHLLGKHRITDLLESFRFQTFHACWDEYAATWISAGFGEDPTPGYEETFLNVLAASRDKANGLIADYRVHGDVDQVLAEVYGVYATLMKFACYLVGSMDGFGYTLDDMPGTKSALEGHWFEPYFNRIWNACKAIVVDYGKWPNLGAFEVLGGIVDDIVREGGIHLTQADGGGYHAHIPFSTETMRPGHYEIQQWSQFFQRFTG